MDQSNIDPSQIQHMMAAMVPLIGIFFLLVNALFIVGFWFAFKKAGLSPGLSFLVLIPGVGTLVTLYILAFARWRVSPAMPDYAGHVPMNYAQPGYPPQAYVPPAAYPSTSPTAYPPPGQAPMYPPNDRSANS